MIKYQIGYGLKILFIGVNPHPGSYRRGVPFSNNKMFWYLLHDAGLIEESRAILRDDAKLKYLYLHLFKKKYHYGLLNVSNKPSRTAAEIDKNGVIQGRKRILSAIQKYKPKVVCFVGKITYHLFSQIPHVTYGWQPNIEASKIFVSHAPHHGLARVRIKDFKTLIRLFEN